MSYPLFHPACSRAPAQDLSAEQFAEDFPAESERIEFKEGVPLDQIDCSESMPARAGRRSNAFAIEAC